MGWTTKVHAHSGFILRNMENVMQEAILPFAPLLSALCFLTEKKKKKKSSEENVSLYLKRLCLNHQGCLSFSPVRILLVS